MPMLVIGVLLMVAKWREGFDVVYARRRKREGETWFKLVTARAFYRLFAKMIPYDVPLWKDVTVHPDALDG